MATMTRFEYWAVTYADGTREAFKVLDEHELVDIAARESVEWVTAERINLDKFLSITIAMSDSQ